MPGTAQPNVGLLQGWADQEDGWGPGMNSNLRTLDALVQARVADKDLAAPPGSPTDGVLYIVAAAPTGDWSGRAGQLARWKAASAGTGSAAWEFITPRAGWVAWVVDESKSYRYSGTAWADATPIDPRIVPINDQTGTSYTLVLADAGKVVRQNNSGAIATTIPLNATVAFDVGTTVSFRQVGAGQITVAVASGGTLNIPAGLTGKTARQGSVIMAHKVATDIWDLTGDLSA